MNKDIMALTLSVTTVVSASIVSANTIAKIKNKEINSLQMQVKDNNIQIETFATENDELKRKVENLEKDLNDKSEDLKSATNKLKEYHRITSFDRSNVTTPSYATIVHLERALKDTNLYSLADAFVDAEKQYGINSYFLAAICAHESGWGNSNRAKSQNNLTGHAVYSSISRGSTFDSKYQNIMSTAKMLKENYLSTNGMYYRGLSVDSVNENYCFLEDGKTVDYKWASSVSQIAVDLKNVANNESVTK